MVTINEFNQIELVIGKIIGVDELQTKKPMYRLEIDLGDKGKRNIAAGIKNYYTKEELIGKNVVIVANLEPKNIGGIFVSEGMVLAAQDGDIISILTTEKEVRPGSLIG